MPRIADGALVTKRKMNDAGGPSYDLSNRQKVLRALFLGGVGPTYYASAEQLNKQAKAYFQQAAKTDATWFATAIQAARTKGLNRSAPIHALAYLSTGDVEAKAQFARIFGEVITNPGDLQDFMNLVRGTGKVRGLSGVTRRAVRTWLGGMSTYHAIKYGSNKQGFALRDIYRLSRGKYTGASQAIAHYLVKGEVTDADLIPQIAAYEEFKGLVQQSNFDGALQTVQTARLPWEVVSPQFPLSSLDRARMAEVWTVMSRQMPYMALMRNLRNLLASGALDDPTVMRDVTYKLTRAENVAYSKQYPFRFYAAYQMMEKTHEGTAEQRGQLRAALLEALELSVANVPDLGRLAILNDMSGSMMDTWSQKRLSDDALKFADIGGLFTAALAKRNPGAAVVSFNHNVHPRTYSADDNLVTLMRNFAQGDGGTAIWKAIHYVIGGRRDFEHISNGWGWSSYNARSQSVRTVEPGVYDMIIILTDSQSWDGEWYQQTNGSTTRQLIEQYVANVNPKAQFVFIQLAQNEASVVPEDLPNCSFVSGWSNMVFDYLRFVREGLDNLAAGMIA